MIDDIVQANVNPANSNSKPAPASDFGGRFKLTRWVGTAAHKIRLTCRRQLSRLVRLVRLGLPRRRHEEACFWWSKVDSCA